MSLITMRLFFILMIFSIALQAFSNPPTNPNQKMEEMINEMFKARNEMFKSFFDDTDFQGFDKRFEDLIKRVQKSHFNGLDDLNFFQNEGPIIGEYDWMETDTDKIFVLKIKQIKNKPLDIKIEKGFIKFKGEVETIDDKLKNKKKTKVLFERTFSIPTGVDQDNPIFENKPGEILIKFKKINGAKLIPLPKEKEDQII